MMTLGETIRTIRKRSKMSQGALAKKAGVSRNTVSLLERNNLNVTIGTVSAICAALDFSVDISLHPKNAA